MRRTLTILALLLSAAIVVAAGPVAAQTYGGPTPPSVDPPPTPGTDVTAFGVCPGGEGALVEVRVVPPGTLLASMTAGPGGMFSLMVAVPTNAAPGAVLRITCDGMAVGDVVIENPGDRPRGGDDDADARDAIGTPDAGSGPLARTGADLVAPLAAIGAASAALGTGAVVLARRRRAPLSS